jgi:L-malate glycosyltransferase
MKVAFVWDLLYPVTKGGVEKRIWELGRGLVDRGHDVHLFPAGYWGPETVRTADGLVVHAVGRPRPLHTRRGRRSVRQAVAYALGLLRALRRHEFEVIDCQAPAYLACMSGAVRARRQATDAAVVITWHEVWGTYWLDYVGRSGRLAVELERRCVRLADHHVAVSSHTAARLAALGVQRHTVVPNGVDLEQIGRVAPADESWDVIAVGRLTKEKNVGLLLDALHLLQRRGRPLRTAIIGDGPERPALQEQARALGLEQVTFTGRVEHDHEVLAHLRAARVYALPSTREGFGIAALEAAACGVPVVTTDHEHNAAKAFVTSGADGVVTAPRPEAFADGLRGVVDADAWAGWSQRAREKARAFSWERAVEQLDDLYRTVASGAARRQDTTRA